MGDLLRHWRQAARRSQLDLASASGVSARHLSFVETGRARASRALLLHLAEHLEMPLRERNALVLAAGYAPAYAESDLGAEHLRSAREALAHLLAGHEPYPALVLDRWGDVLMTNAGSRRCCAASTRSCWPRRTPTASGCTPVASCRACGSPRPGSPTSATGWNGRCAGAATPASPPCGGEVRDYPGVVDVLDSRPDPAAQELLLTVTFADPYRRPQPAHRR